MEKTINNMEMVKHIKNVAIKDIINRIIVLRFALGMEKDDSVRLHYSGYDMDEKYKEEHHRTNMVFTYRISKDSICVDAYNEDDKPNSKKTDKYKIYNPPFMDENDLIKALIPEYNNLIIQYVNKSTHDLMTQSIVNPIVSDLDRKMKNRLFPC